MCLFTLVLLLGCSLCRATQTLLEVQIASDNRKRNFYVHQPRGKHPTKGLPLIIGLHGGGSSAEHFTRDANGGFIKISDRDGVYIVYPQGIDKHWNDGNRSCCGHGKCRVRSENINDVKFMSDIIDYMKKKYAIDEKRVYVAGISNGGLMTYRLALEMPQRFAAVGVVTANMHIDHETTTKRLKTKRPISVMIINGTKDKAMPWKGGQLAAFLKFGQLKSTRWAVNYWRKHNSCSAIAKRVPFKNKEIFDFAHAWKETYSGGRNGTEVVLIGVEGGGHTWPGGLKSQANLLTGAMCNDFSACEELWSFFKRHRLDGSTVQPTHQPQPEQPQTSSPRLMWLTKNIPYAKRSGFPTKLTSLDIHPPLGAKSDGNLPVAVLIHGGGWMGGDKGDLGWLYPKTFWLCANGYLVVSVNYRLSPKVKHPAHIEDANAAIAWIQKNISNYGGNPNRLILIGHSAGACISALAAVDNKRLRKAGADPKKIKGVVLLDAAAYNVPKIMPSAHPLIQLMYKKAFGEGTASQKDGSPINWVKLAKVLPPFLFVHCAKGKAPNMPAGVDALEFANELRNAGAKVTFVPVAGKSHDAFSHDLGKPGDPTTKALKEFLSKL